MVPRSETRGSGAARLAREMACTALLAGAVAMTLPPTSAYSQGWEPTKPIQFVIPAGTGGGADQMARFIQGVITKNNLMSQPVVVVNKSGGAGAEGFLEVKGAKAQPHTIIITLSMFHYFTEGFMWKRGAPHRKHVPIHA